MRNLWVLLALGLMRVSAIHSQELIFRVNTGAYRIIERSNWSRYDNGRYIGHVYRETRAALQPLSEDKDTLIYQGNFYVLEETLRDMQQSARAVNDIIPVRFTIDPTGSLFVAEDNGYPQLRGFPSFPAGAVLPGSKWTAEGLRIVDPLNEGFSVEVPFLAEYEYRGTEVYKGFPVYRVSARYACRYQAPFSEAGYFISLTGTHQVEILLKVSDGLPLLIMDNLDETFTWVGGKTVRFRGFTQTFGEASVPLTTAELTLPVDWEKRNNIELAPVPGGIKMTVKDIRFVPDSAEFLPGEYGRLDIIAEALRNMTDRNFLVEGHTASIGQAAEEMELSILRARRMIDELVRRGIGADRFIYKGWGGTQPLGDNSTEEGRALNRRVEITILE